MQPHLILSYVNQIIICRKVRSIRFAITRWINTTEGLNQDELRHISVLLSIFSHLKKSEKCVNVLREGGGGFQTLSLFLWYVAFPCPA